MQTCSANAYIHGKEVMHKDGENKRALKVLVCGDRNWGCREPQQLHKEQNTRERKAILEWLCKLQDFDYDTVVEGEARGADSIARDAALLIGMTVKPYPADWASWGRGAGFMRNRLQYDSELPDLVLAFHSNITASKGTKDMVNYAKSKGCKVIVVTA